MRQVNLLVFAGIFLLISASKLQGQTMTLENGSTQVTVEGTSNVHDWEMTTATAKGKAVIELQDQILSALKDLEVTIPATSLKSGKGGMDKNAYKALKTNKHENIHFKLKECRKITNSGPDTYKIAATGNMTIAGKSRPVEMDMTAKLTPEGLVLSGENKITMTQYDVDPPTAMFGTITTGDEVNVKFNAHFKN